MDTGDGVVNSWPRALLRLEGACIFASTLWAYWRSGLSWWLFAGGLFIPDLGMTGYILNTRAGAAAYNLFHTETPAVLLLCAGYARNSPPTTAAGLIWLAHINMDRMFGFGLKYGTGFGHTHLGVIGKKEN